MAETKQSKRQITETDNLIVATLTEAGRPLTVAELKDAIA